MSRFKAARGRKPFSHNLSGPEHPSESVHASILKNARRSGVLNLSQRGLEVVPDAVWTIQEDVPLEARDVSLDNTDDKWWETNDLTKLILASNRLTQLGEGLRNLGALTVLDVHDNALTSLPKAISSLENLQRLDISRNQLTELPPGLGLLHRLASLQADHNQLTTLCEDVCSIKELDKLDISNNQIQSLPRYICLLNRLRFLNISNNKLTQLPPDLGSLGALFQLDATHNQLSSVPDELGMLATLEQLYLRHNRLTHLPVLRHCGKLKEILVGNNQIQGLSKEHLEPLSALTMLDLRDNKLSKLPDEITLLESLERLDLTNNDISALPYTLGTMTALKAVVLDGNPLRSVRRDIIMRGTQELKKYLASRLSDDDHQAAAKPKGGSSAGVGVGPPGAATPIKAEDLHAKTLDYSNQQATGLPDDVLSAAVAAGVRALNLSRNQLTQLPSSLSVLSGSLRELNLGQNRLATLAPAVNQYTGLHMLDLRINQLSDLPAEMAALSSLRELVLSQNRFSAIPCVVYSLTNLEILFLNDNQIASLDVAALSSLGKLATFDLQNNNLTQVAPELGNLTQIKSLQLSGNPLRNPRPAILAKGTLAILEYLRSRIVT